MFRLYKAMSRLYTESRHFDKIFFTASEENCVKMTTFSSRCINRIPNICNPFPSCLLAVRHDEQRRALSPAVLSEDLEGL